MTRVATHHLYHSMCSKCPPPARTQAVDIGSLTQLANSTFSNCVTQSSPLAFGASFRFVDVRS